jgi:CubicO group peptidase (beta-lactamase class C family)
MCYSIGWLALSLLSVVEAFSEGISQCGSPAVASDGWTVASQIESGLQPERLCALIAKLDASPQLNIHAVLIVRDGKLVFEHYRRGDDQSWGRPLGLLAHDMATLHDVRSVTKSIVSILFGIALDRKLVGSADEPVMSFFPELANEVKDKNAILLRHMLSMNSGIAWDESLPYADPRNSEVQMNHSTKPFRYVLTQPMATEAGKTWNYSGGSFSVIAEIVQRASGKPIEEFARDVLFEPLGIDDFKWIRTAGGTIAAASGLRLRPRDMAKLGQMVLAGGEWNGRRIVSADWIKQSTSAHIPADEYQYGYGWWIASSVVNGRTYDWFEAYGYGAQRVIVVPELSLVAVIATGMYGNEAGFPATTELFEKFILPAALPH